MGDRQVLNKAQRIVTVLSEFNPLSFAFRYPIDIKGEPSIDLTVRLINVRHFEEQIDDVAVLLEGIDIYLSVLADMKNEFLRTEC